MKKPLRVLGLYVFPIFKYLSKSNYFAQIYRAQYGVTLKGHKHGGRKIVHTSGRLLWLSRPLII